MPQHALDFATQLARQAGELLRQRFRLGGTFASLKADRTYVTEADLAADRFIRSAIGQEFPQDAILTEETPADLPASAPGIWVVDPLDGTTNYSLGLHIWGVSIARLVGGWPETAAVYFPLIDELYTAQRGAGAWLNGQPIQARQPTGRNSSAPSQPLAFFACCSRTQRRYTVNLRYKTRILGSSAYTLCLVARGVALLGFEVTPKLWDLAAAWLVVSEAGGVVAAYDGASPFPFQPGVSDPQTSYPILAAATAELAETARSQIQPKATP